MSDSDQAARIYSRIVPQTKDVAFSYRWTRPRGFTFISQSIDELTGYDSNAWLADPLIALRLLGHADRRRLWNAFNSTSPDGQTVRLCLQHRDGTTRWVDVTLVPTFDGQGTLTVIDGLARDVTAETIATEGLDESEQRFRAIVETAPFGVFIHDWGTLRFLNTAARIILRIDTDSGGEGRNILDFVVPEDRQRVMDIGISRRRHQNAPAQYEVGLLRSDGTTCPAIVGIQTFEQQGETLHMVTFSDISSQKEAELELREHSELERCITTLAARFINIDPGDIEDTITQSLKELGQHLDVDRCFVTLVTDDYGHFGASYGWVAPGIDGYEDILKGVSVNDFPWVVERFLGDQMLHIPDVSQMPPEAESARRLFEMQNCKATMVLPMLASGHMLGVFGIEQVRDVKAWSDETINLLRMFAQILAYVIVRKASEEARLQYEARIRQSQKFESLGILAGGIAHDFNNLLMSILGNASLAKQDLGAGHSVYPAVESIELASVKAAELTRQMLVYAGRSMVSFEPVNLGQRIRKMQPELQGLAGDTIQIVYELNDNLPPIKGDAVQVGQVIESLASNAVEAMEEHGGTLTIEVASVEVDAVDISDAAFAEKFEPGTYVGVTVSDTGCGMDAEIVKRIFDPFFSTKFAGRGLGLAATLGIVRGHRGIIFVTSEVGRGARVKVLFPATKDHERKAVRSNSHRGASEEKGGIVLIVDDELAVLDVAKRITERLGFQALTATNGPDGIVTFRGHLAEVRLVILDMMMPKMSGEEVLKEIRMLNPEVPVVMSSGYTHDSLGERFNKYNHVEFIQKPYRSAELIEVMRALLEF